MPIQVIIKQRKKDKRFAFIGESPICYYDEDRKTFLLPALRYVDTASHN